MDKENLDWMEYSWKSKYQYHMTWKGVTVLQYPQDLIGIQDIIWETKPSLIIETGVAYGGQSLFMEQFADVISIEKGLMEETKNTLKDTRVKLLEGSSTDKNIVERVKWMISMVDGENRVMVVLDSNHTYNHVLEELNIYSEFVTKGCYLVVQDTWIEFMPDNSFPGKEFCKGNNPHTAVMEFLKTTDRFEIDKDIENKLGITCAPDGWLRCVK